MKDEKNILRLLRVFTDTPKNQWSQILKMDEGFLGKIESGKRNITRFVVDKYAESFNSSQGDIYTLFSQCKSASSLQKAHAIIFEFANTQYK